ncbi:MAG TPA: hypothetical protein VGD94_23540 [Vicinamibacterales bacterium]
MSDVHPTTDLGRMVLRHTDHGTVPLDAMIAAVRPIAAQRILETGIDTPEPGHLFDALGLQPDRPLWLPLWTEACMLMACAYVLGIATGQQVPCFAQHTTTEVQ